MTAQSLRICLIEDDELMGEALGERFEMEGFFHDWHKCGKNALLALQRRRYNVVVSDIRLPDLSGEEIFSELRRAQVALPPFLFMTAHGAISQAVRLLKLGAADYVPKPLDIDLLVARIRELGNASGTVTETPEEGVLGVSTGMQRVEQMLQRVAATDGTVLITGETGVGKELVARRLHALGESGQSKPFVAVNCAAIPDTLLESEMFGFEKGAFTGAVKERSGYFEQADGGTLFLDEIGDMPAVMQVKLLRAIQERTVTRVGSAAPIRVNVRLLCATHEDLRQLVVAGRFREDLYYRINVIHVAIPPLRERRDDILWLARKFLDEQSAKRGGTPFSFTAAAERILWSHPWPGNVRELKHCLERACILADHPLIGPEALLGEREVSVAGTSGAGGTLGSHLDACEKHYLEQALAAHTWRIGESADSLGISRKNLWEKMRKHGIVEPSKRVSS